MATGVDVREGERRGNTIPILSDNHDIYHDMTFLYYYSSSSFSYRCAFDIIIHYAPYLRIRYLIRLNNWK
jgi:hypothetical protein